MYGYLCCQKNGGCLCCHFCLYYLCPYLLRNGSRNRPGFCHGSGSRPVVYLHGSGNRPVVCLHGSGNRPVVCPRDSGSRPAVYRHGSGNRPVVYLHGSGSRPVVYLHGCLFPDNRQFFHHGSDSRPVVSHRGCLFPGSHSGFCSGNLLFRSVQVCFPLPEQMSPVPVSLLLLPALVLSPQP